MCSLLCGVLCGEVTPLSPPSSVGGLHLPEGRRARQLKSPLLMKHVTPDRGPFVWTIPANTQSPGNAVCHGSEWTLTFIKNLLVRSRIAFLETPFNGFLKFHLLRF